MPSQKLPKKNGIPVKTYDGTIAGSVLFICDMFKKWQDKFMTPFKNLVMYSSINPAKNLGIENEYEISIGKSPNFTVWDKDSARPVKTFIT